MLSHVAENFLFETMRKMVASGDLNCLYAKRIYSKLGSVLESIGDTQEKSLFLFPLSLLFPSLLPLLSSSLPLASPSLSDKKVMKLPVFAGIYSVVLMYFIRRTVENMDLDSTRNNRSCRLLTLLHSIALHRICPSSD